MSELLRPKKKFVWVRTSLRLLYGIESGVPFRNYCFQVTSALFELHDHGTPRVFQCKDLRFQRFDSLLLFLVTISKLHSRRESCICISECGNQRRGWRFGMRWRKRLKKLLRNAV